MSRQVPCIYCTEDLHCTKFSEPDYESWCVLGPCTNETPSSGDKLRNMEDEMISCNYNKTFSEMAMDLGISERILRYKLEAMRLKGADIDPQELERYDRMFDNVI